MSGQGSVLRELFFGKNKARLAVGRAALALLLLGAILMLVACSVSLPPPDTQLPPPEVPQECPEVDIPTPERYDELWKSSPHADENAEAFRHWDATNPQAIPVECAACHSRPGFIDFLGVDGTQIGTVENPIKVGTTLTCFVCHNEATYTLDSVTFPSGKRIGSLGREALCISCHQGRASTSTVSIAIRSAGLTDDDQPSDKLVFVNSHAISAATPFGSEAAGAYEYAGNIYKGRYARGGDFFACMRCHDQHSLELRIETCHDCHTFEGVDPLAIRVNTTDFDGDGDIVEGIAREVEQIQAALYGAIQAYATNVAGTPIAYDLGTYPYFFLDNNQNGRVDPEEAVASNRYNQFTPRLLRAAYNYNYAAHDPGAYAHNSMYIIQVLLDSLVDIGGDISGMTRP